MYRPERIVDSHCHLACDECTPAEFFAGVAANMAVRSAFEGVHTDPEMVTALMRAQHKDPKGDELRAAMDLAGISRTVLLAPDFSYVFKSAVSYEDLARRHREARARHPGRFWVFQGVDPRWGSAGYSFFERCIEEYGFEGLKLYPPCGYSPSDRALYPLYEICRDRGLPVLLHTGPTTPTLEFSYADPYLIDRAAFDFPTVNFILAHGGVNFVESATLMCMYRPNVYLDISPFPVVLTDDSWQEHLRRLFAKGLNHKILFGTDWPVAGRREGLANLLDQMFAEQGPLSGLDSQSIDAMFHGTIERLVGKPAVSPQAVADKDSVESARAAAGG